MVGVLFCCRASCLIELHFCYFRFHFVLFFNGEAASGHCLFYATKVLGLNLLAGVNYLMSKGKLRWIRWEPLLFHT